ncbi:hypothetical protein AB0I94_34080 [Streptomyces sp. NPDC050147]|uniref:hypothetical protein n=1 Tax=Streptomyces sp. NPDC050147 TaxID=3155513 RepID=UPI0034126B3F
MRPLRSDQAEHDALAHRAGLPGLLYPRTLIIDNALAAPEEAAQRVRSRLRSLARHGQPAAWDEEDDGGEGWDEDGEEDEELTARTAAVLRVALEELSERAGVSCRSRL